MPGNILAPRPTLVMPQQLCTAFVESRNYEQLRNEYHDGTPQASQFAQTSRRTWKLSRRLPASQLATLRTFWENVGGGLKPFLFYNPYDGSPVGSNYDATGANQTGRYVVAFRSNWMQSTTLSRTDVTQFELVQLDEMSADYAAAAGFGPHGAIVSTTIFAITSHPTTSAVNQFQVNFSLSPLGLLFPPDWISSGDLWGVRTDSKAFSYLDWSGFAIFGFDLTGQTHLDLDPRDELRIYDCWVEVAFSDAHVATIRPTVVQTTINANGGVDNPSNAIDGDPDTYAAVWRTAYTPLGLGTYLEVKGFPGLG